MWGLHFEAEGVAVADDAAGGRAGEVCADDQRRFAGEAPEDVAVDSTGNVWVADSGNNRIAIFDKNLEFIDDITQSFNDPTGVALGPDGDVLYVVDSANQRIVKFDLKFR